MKMSRDLAAVGRVGDEVDRALGRKLLAHEGRLGAILEIGEQQLHRLRLRERAGEKAKSNAQSDCDHDKPSTRGVVRHAPA